MPYQAGRSAQKATAMLSCLARARPALCRASSQFPPRVARHYHDIVIDHYESPRNVGSLNKKVCTIISCRMIVSRIVAT